MQQEKDCPLVRAFGEVLEGREITPLHPEELLLPCAAKIPQLVLMRNQDQAIRDQMYETEEKIRIIADHITDIVWMMNGDFKLVYISKAVHRITGFTPEEALASTPEMRYSLLTLQKMEEMKQLLASGVGPLKNFTLDVELVHKDTGIAIPCETRFTLIATPSGRILGAVGITQDVTIRRQAELEISKLTITDSLTGAYNRGYFFSQFAHEIDRCKRYERPLSALMIDLDHFKDINDTYGHAVGDKALELVARTCISQLRKYSLFGRLGGEEFGLCLQELDIDKAVIVAERLRSLIEELIVPLDAERTVRLTASIGVSQWRGESSAEILLARADRALYEAKASGRNRVIVA